MRIINRTRYSTRTIRTLLAGCHRQIARSEGRLPSWHQLHVQIHPGGREREPHVRSARRLATTPGAPDGDLVFWLPEPRISVRELASSATELLVRAYGMSREHAGAFGGFDWATERFGVDLYPRPSRQRKPKPKTEASEHSRLTAALARWTAKEAMARTKVKKYTRALLRLARKQTTADAEALTPKRRIVLDE